MRSGWMGSVGAAASGRVRSGLPMSGAEAGRACGTRRACRGRTGRTRARIEVRARGPDDPAARLPATPVAIPKAV